jgi:lactate permease
LPLFSLLIPIWLVWVMAGWRGVVGVWPALVVCGGSFALMQYLLANFHGPALVDVGAGVISLVALALFLQVWQPSALWRFPDEAILERERPRAHTATQIVSAWMPWALLSVLVFVFGLPQTKSTLDQTAIAVEIPGLHKAISRDRPVVEQRKEEEAIYRFEWLSSTGTAIFMAAVLSAIWCGMPPARFAGLFLRTCRTMRRPLFAIAAMLAIAFVTRYSGMDATLGLAFTRTGAFYPLFAALLGWLGVALTGSDTSSNALFGSLQVITANQLTLPGAPLTHLTHEQARILLATANSTGGVMGKMIDAQSIVVAAAATQQAGQEGPILRFVFLHSLVLALLMGLLVCAQAYWWTWVIP